MAKQSGGNHGHHHQESSQLTLEIAQEIANGLTLRMSYGLVKMFARNLHPFDHPFTASGGYCSGCSRLRTMFR